LFSLSAINSLQSVTRCFPKDQVSLSADGTRYTVLPQRAPQIRRDGTDEAICRRRFSRDQSTAPSLESSTLWQHDGWRHATDHGHVMEKLSKGLRDAEADPDGELEPSSEPGPPDDGTSVEPRALLGDGNEISVRRRFGNQAIISDHHAKHLLDWISSRQDECTCATPSECRTTIWKNLRATGKSRS
jgi:hypothetical protein